MGMNKMIDVEHREGSGLFLLKKTAFITGLLGIVLLSSSIDTFALARKDIPRDRPPENDQTREEGRKIYFKWCWYCHGEEGDGNGPVADFLDPRPRDFTPGVFKFTTTMSGEIPTDEDLFITISDGLRFTAMPAWEETLPEDERWKVTYFIKTFVPDYEDEEFDPNKNKKLLVNYWERLNKVKGPADVNRGEEVYDEAKCFECHGDEGRGDGRVEVDQEDSWGFPISPRNLRKTWRYNAGPEPEEIFLRTITGINGAPMPAFDEDFNDQDLWNVANFVAEKLQEPGPSDTINVTAKNVEGELPVDPNDPIWEQAEELRVPLSGQIVAAPRWQNHAIDLVKVRALFNDKDVAFLLTWDDRFKDTEHHPENEIKERGDKYFSDRELGDSYVKAQPGMAASIVGRYKTNNFRDSIALQFPVTIPETREKPHFLRGTGKSVNLWLWKSDMEEAGKNPVVETNTKHFKNPMKVQPEESQSTTGKGVYKNGQWKVVMKRSLTTEDPKKDIQFERGKLIPFALNAWEGTNGEHQLVMGLSAWSFVYIPQEIPPRVYLYALLGVVIAGGIEFWIVRKARSS
jgi:mono/diheme cytochrome c family protein